VLEINRTTLYKKMKHTAENGTAVGAWSASVAAAPVRPGRESGVV